MKNMVFLTSTDTAIGFVSKDSKALDRAKQRIGGKKYITAISSLKALNKRVPKKYKKLVRRAKKTTFIIDKNFSFRIIKNSNHNLLLNRLGLVYTTSANKSGEKFNLNYAHNNANIIIYPLKNSNSSTIYKLGKSKIKRIR